MANQFLTLPIPEENLEKLRCILCKEYLTQFPIFTDPQKGNICGRCTVPKDRYVIRNYAFENLAEILPFPCRYTLFGCTEMQTPLNLQKHEERCVFRQYDCVLLPKGRCFWKGRIDELVEHFGKSHEDYYINDGSFYISRKDFECKCEENYLLTFKENVFVAHFVTHVDRKSIECSVSMIGTKENCENYRYQLQLENERAHNVDVFYEVQEVNQYGVDDQELSGVEIFLASVINLMNSVDKLSCELVIFDTREFKKNLAVLN